MKIDAHIVHAFTEGGRGGNPAGVVLDADALGPARRQAIARELGLAETAFVSASRNATVRVEFYTPTRQIPHCGHGTVATFALLRRLERIGDGVHTKESVEDIREIRVGDGRVAMRQPAPVFEPVSVRDSQRLAVALRFGNGFASAPVVGDAGNRFLLAELPSVDALRRLAPDMAAVHALGDDLRLVGVHAFARTDPSTGIHASARMFGPGYGIPEDAATGMAAGPLGAWLSTVGGATGDRFAIEQGAWMPVPSRSVLQVELLRDGDGITGVVVGGEATVIATRTITLPDTPR